MLYKRQLILFNSTKLFVLNWYWLAIKKTVQHKNCLAIKTLKHHLLSDLLKKKATGKIQFICFRRQSLWDKREWFLGLVECFIKITYFVSGEVYWLFSFFTSTIVVNIKLEFKVWINVYGSTLSITFFLVAKGTKCRNIYLLCGSFAGVIQQYSIN